MLKPLPPRPARGVRLARGLLLFALVVMAEAAVARWFDLIGNETLLGALAAALLIAVAGLVADIVALRDVWRDGAPGFGGAAAALLLALLALAPFAGAGIAAAVYPPVLDVSTDLADPPRFAAGPLRLPALAPDRQAQAFPDLRPHTVALSSVEAHAAAHLAVTELGWTIRRESEPAGETDGGTLEAEARSWVFAIPQDVSIRIVPEGEGSRVDIRVRSGVPGHDLGENARRIRAFFGKLDEIMTRPAAG